MNYDISKPFIQPLQKKRTAENFTARWLTTAQKHGTGINNTLISTPHVIRQTRSCGEVLMYILEENGDSALF